MGASPTLMLHNFQKKWVFSNEIFYKVASDGVDSYYITEYVVKRNFEFIYLFIFWKIYMRRLSFFAHNLE